MQAFTRNGTTLHYSLRGNVSDPALVFSNSLGTDFRIWDQVVDGLPPDLCILRYDKRGHGLSDLPEGEWGMADHVADLSGLMDHLGLQASVICGLSVGGMIAQGLAAERPDLVHALILCDTGAKIGTPDMWQERIETALDAGISAMADGVMQRWFTEPFRTTDPTLPIWRNMLCRITPGGYAGTCQAIADTDLQESTSRLRVPCLGICGAQDGATPPDLVRETTALIPGSRFELIKDAGHIPCVEQPERTTELIAGFLSEIGHITA
ncbi:MAG: 3-oxoadipate enol-lactonase [Pseudomonadota bacterium]